MQEGPLSHPENRDVKKSIAPTNQEEINFMLNKMKIK
jgi:hypothetical protein